MSESYFAKLTNEVLEASEKLVDRFEEGMNILWGELEGTGSSGSRSTTQQQEQPLEQDEFAGWDADETGMDNEASPLAGIAESVMGDIMAGQVCMYARAVSFDNNTEHKRFM